MTKADARKTKQRIWWHLASALRLLRMLGGYGEDKLRIAAIMARFSSELTEMSKNDID